MNQNKHPLPKVSLRRLVIAGACGVSFGLILWMLTLPAGFISKSRMAISASAALGITYLFYRFLLPYVLKHQSKFRRRWVVIVPLYLLLTCIVVNLILPHQGLLFPFLPKNTLEVSLTSGSVAFQPMTCELVTVYARQFTSTGTFTRVSSEELHLTGEGASLSWSGWTGAECTFTVIESSPADNLEFRWNGAPLPAETAAGKSGEVAYRFHFPVTVAAKLCVAVIVAVAMLAGFILVTCIVMFLSMLPPLKYALVSANSLSRPVRWITSILLALLPASLLARFLYSINPYTAYPSTDSGVFLYLGQALLRGKTPYLDLWDHKGPLIYFLNALGKLLDPGGEWGVFGLQVVFLLATLFFIYLMLRRSWSKAALYTGLCFYLVLLPFFSQRGNLVEFYALPFYTIGLYAGMLALRSGKIRPLFWLGVSAALSFALRPNLISVFIVLFLAWGNVNLKKGSLLLKGTLVTLAGALLILLPIVGFFGARGALPDLVDQAFLYNWYYARPSEIGLITRLTTFSADVLPLVLGGLLALYFTLAVQPAGTGKPRDDLMLVLCASFLLEIGFAGVSGYDFAHYFLPLLLLAAILLVFFTDLLVKKFTTGQPEKTPRFIVIPAGILLLGLNGLAIAALARLDLTPRQLVPPRAEMAAFLGAHTPLLMWGNETWYMYEIDAAPPTRYVYQYPLLNNAYCSDAKGDEFLQAVRTKLPVIIDASSTNSWTPSLDPVLRESETWKAVSFGEMRCLQGFYRFVDENYGKGFTFEQNNWKVYLPLNAAP